MIWSDSILCDQTQSSILLNFLQIFDWVFVLMNTARIEFFRPEWCKSRAAMRGFFRENAAQISYIFLGCIGLPTAVKRCRSEDVKDKLTPHSYIILDSQGG